jgi:hypothetical protein
MPDPKSAPTTVIRPNQQVMVGVYLTSSPTPETPVALFPDSDAADRFIRHNFRWYDSEPAVMRSVIVTMTPLSLE